uniref:GDP-Man:Man(3)GlcNAc(2)-PP-Dol alpha-1,2-mannosyltransferase n=1 Tax=Schizophyllum commune (strain H4-8 / FGSC 9210) TaxID=578458 RepID=D8PZ69_SCHCM
MAFKFWDRYRRTKFLEPFNRHPTDGHTKIIGFFHPYCNAGGGGERVLWTAVAAMQRSNPNLVCAIYSGDTDATKDDIIAKVQSRFAITLDSRALGFVFLQSRYLVEDTTWPRFTLLGQSVGSMLLALEAMLYLRPDLYIDTMGYAFTYPIFKIFGGVTCGAYVHYPTISTDMLARVESRRNWHTNSSWISSSPILTQGKLLYYRIFMHFYAVSLRQASFVMANSTWTKNHSTAADYALRVYPPCDTTEMAKYPLEGREPIIISVAQFRPEKDHPAQLRALYELFDAHPEYRETVRLILIGGSRNAEDAARVELLRTLAAKLGIQDSIEFRINAPYPDMLEMLGRSSIGLSTMVDEHFGINVVEYMAAGVIPLAHASAGPLLDIVTPWEGQPTGFHATTPQEYAEKLHHILTLPPDEDLAMRERARTAALSRFSEAEFVRRWDMSGWQKWLEAE